MTSSSDELELVYDLRHQTVVVDALADLGYAPVPGQRSADLNLGLMSLSQHSAGDPDVLLDIALFSLRRLCRSRHAGWEPVVGKNRRLDPLHPINWSTGPGGEGDPVVVTRSGPTWHVPSGTLGRGVRIGLIDTPIDPTPFPGLDIEYVGDDARFDSMVADGDPALGHATFVAGCIFSQAPGATLVVDPVFGTTAPIRASSWDVATKMAEFAYRHEVDILNLSLGCTTDDNRAPLVLSRALRLLTPEIQVVAATGNEPADTPGYQPGTPMWPAAAVEAIAVAASVTGEQEELASFSPHRVPWASLTAPGTDLTSAYVRGTVLVNDLDGKPVPTAFDGSATWSGTSFAAATVTGYLAANVSDGRGARDVAIALLNGDSTATWAVPSSHIRPYR